MLYPKKIQLFLKQSKLKRSKKFQLSSLKQMLIKKKYLLKINGKIPKKSLLDKLKKQKKKRPLNKLNKDNKSIQNKNLIKLRTFTISLNKH